MRLRIRAAGTICAHAFMHDRALPKKYVGSLPGMAMPLVELAASCNLPRGNLGNGLVGMDLRCRRFGQWEDELIGVVEVVRVGAENIDLAANFAGVVGWFGV